MSYDPVTGKINRFFAACVPAVLFTFPVLIVVALSLPATDIRASSETGEAPSLSLEEKRPPQLNPSTQYDIKRPTFQTESLVAKGRYLAQIGLCAACHTAPSILENAPAPTDGAELERERRYKTDPDWFLYIDPLREKPLAGGVPFILRIPNLKTFAIEHGTVVTANITPDTETGLGTWSEKDIAKVLRTGIRKDGKKLFLFPPHTFFQHLAEDDLLALVVYLKALQPIHNKVPDRTLPEEIVAQYWSAATSSEPGTPVSSPPTGAPQGRSLARAKYLMTGLVGCMECHSYHSFESGKSILHPFAGGDPQDPYQAVFRLGPDLPLRASDKGWATFPYPGYAVLYGPNLSRFGLSGDLSHITVQMIVRAIRQGIAPTPDRYGREESLSYVMPWQFYGGMTDDDAYSISEYLKTLEYVPHRVSPRLILYGEDWRAAFEKVFGTKPSVDDAINFGKASNSK